MRHYRSAYYPGKGACGLAGVTTTPIWGKVQCKACRTSREHEEFMKIAVKIR